MFERFWTYTKEHPWVVAGLVGLGVILIWYFSSSGSSSSTQSGIYAETQDPNVVAANASEANTQNQDNAAISIASLQAQQAAQQDLLASQMAEFITNSNNTAAISIAGLQANVTNNQTAAAQAVAQTSTADQLQAALAINDLNTTTVNDQLQAALAATSAAQNVANTTTAAQLQSALATTAATQAVDTTVVNDQLAASIATTQATAAVTTTGLNLSSGLSQQALADAFTANAPVSIASPIGDVTLGTTQAIPSPSTTAPPTTTSPPPSPPPAVAAPSAPPASPSIFDYMINWPNNAGNLATVGRSTPSAPANPIVTGTSPSNALASYIASRGLPATYINSPAGQSILNHGVTLVGPA